MPRLSHQMRQLLEAADEGFAVLDRSSTPVYANAAARRLLALDRTSLDTDGRRALSDHLPGGVVAAYDRVSGGGPAELVQEYCPSLRAPVRARVVPVQDGTGLALAAVSGPSADPRPLAIDPEAPVPAALSALDRGPVPPAAEAEEGRLVRLEAELTASRQRYRDVFNSTSIGVLLIQADGPVLEANAAICRMLGYSREALLRMQGPDLLPPSGPDPARERDKVLTDGLEGYEQEVELARSDGHRLPALVTVNVIAHGDSEKTVSVLVRDQSRVRELQDRLVAAERLEVAGRLAAGVAHDANNILTAASAYADLLRRELDGSPQALRHLGGIDRTIERAGGLVSQLVAFTRGQRLEAGEVDLAHVVQDLEDMLDRVLPEGVLLVLDLQAAPAAADEAQVGRVVLNLVVNARDALNGRGRIRVTCGLQDVVGDSTVADGTWAYLSVEDDGPGMDEEVARRCFEPFFTTRAAQAGRGLGLSTAFGIARQHGGDLQVRTAPGRGAEFRLYLPPASDHGGAPAPPPTAAADPPAEVAAHGPSATLRRPMA